jgi:uncharacterized coiled-coil DUF342 family protein
MDKRNKLINEFGELAQQLNEVYKQILGTFRKDPELEDTESVREFKDAKNKYEEIHEKMKKILDMLP